MNLGEGTSTSTEPLEYFVPRSVSEFNLSGVSDVSLAAVTAASRTPARTRSGETTAGRSREKMVTFEDEPPRKTTLEDVFM